MVHSNMPPHIQNNINAPMRSHIHAHIRSHSKAHIHNHLRPMKSYKHMTKLCKTASQHFPQLALSWCSRCFGDVYSLPNIPAAPPLVGVPSVFSSLSAPRQKHVKSLLCSTFWKHTKFLSFRKFGKNAKLKIFSKPWKNWLHVRAPGHHCQDWRFSRISKIWNLSVSQT